MTAAIFGLVGVVVGAVVTGAVSWLLERRREAAEARAAARLLKSEVTAACEDIDSALHEGKWPIAYRPTWRQSWSTYRRPLAVVMQATAFDEVAVAYSRMDQLQGGFSAARAEDQRELSYADREFFTRTQPALETARERLDEFLSGAENGQA
jgi:hypothetical protein